MTTLILTTMMAVIVVLMFCIHRTNVKINNSINLLHAKLCKQKEEIMKYREVLEDMTDNSSHTLKDKPRRITERERLYLTAQRNASNKMQYYHNHHTESVSDCTPSRSHGDSSCDSSSSSSSSSSD